MYDINRAIPGLMSTVELMRLSELAAAVPENGIIVEVGSLYGLSSWHLAKHSKPSVTVFCIDTWTRQQWIIDQMEKDQHAPEFSQRAFQMMTHQVRDKIVCIRGHSPYDMLGWKLPVNMYFDDSIHANPGLRYNLDFWCQKMVHGGVVCGHDYIQTYPDVIAEADRIAKTYHGTLRCEQHLWYTHIWHDLPR